MLRGRTIVVGVSGGIAAYKACELVRRLKDAGAGVIVVMTPAAAEFVTALTFEALSGNPVVKGLWGSQRVRFELPRRSARRVRGRVEHVDVAEAADGMVIAPATADVIARLAHGEAPDALTAVALALRTPLVVCPAMDLEMWRHAATQDNLRTLRSRGVVQVGPEEGPLASGLSGPGRLADTPAIVAAIELALERRASMKGTRVLVSAGRTEEPIDPVRVLTNRSSGRMGFALAEAARDRGADVTLVSGESNVEPPQGVKLERVHTAAEMERAVLAAAPKSDLVLMAAAVSDFRPMRERRDKIKRQAATLSLELAPNPDILARAASRRKSGQVFVGFALETSAGLRHAREKLVRKRLDLVVLNRPADSVGRTTNRVTLVARGGATRLPELLKREVAEHILDRALELRRGRSAGALGKGAHAKGGRRPARGSGTEARIAGTRVARKAARKAR